MVRTVQTLKGDWQKQWQRGDKISSPIVFRNTRYTLRSWFLNQSYINERVCKVLRTILKETFYLCTCVLLKCWLNSHFQSVTRLGLKASHSSHSMACPITINCILDFPCTHLPDASSSQHHLSLKGLTVNLDTAIPSALILSFLKVNRHWALTLTLSIPLQDPSLLIYFLCKRITAWYYIFVNINKTLCNESTIVISL